MAAAQVINNAGHDDMIHDAVLDYYGRRLATCSSDRTIKIFEIEGETQRLTDTLKGHEGAVWCVSWAHPKYGNILASSGYDGKVFIWREQQQQANANSSSTNLAASAAAASQQQNQQQQQQLPSNGPWQRLFDFALHSASVNIVSWSPHESGCLLACASSDGNVSVLEFRDDRFEHTTFPAHGLGVNSVSWAPAIAPGAIISSNPGSAQQQQQQQSAGAAGSAASRRFVTGGCDNVLRLWTFDTATNNYVQEQEPLQGHTDWVRDVAWSPTVLQKSYIASASQDKTVRIWTTTSSVPAAGAPPQQQQQQGQGQAWTSKVLNTFDAPVWRVSWSLSGNVLAVSSGDNKVTLWKENLRGEWECVKTLDE